ncbi:FemAB family XrtA/PEP-CTERM system-associated protein [Reinekea marinisedimentorum]|uniref:FemAB-related protein (PEP-CTERM system-associated) n=1 Tax=Reinekea marinisedimentorum TaxID=230495 RepID=A0A4R3IEC0_9GAMM|nr:FemAB family XrtA/PEP-CTERM system-associated protein [Reinekea marinisedimentorum]TCS44107.1 FemAB-related protein (PEP-CTERM system-associated) [Reinekea marinisedimentorum]
MDVKKILKEPEAFIASFGRPLDSQYLQDLQSLQSAYKAYTKALKAAQNKKKSISSQFKQIDKKPDNLEQLKSDVKEISTEVKAIEAEIKATTKAARELIEKIEHTNNTNPSPAQFQHLEAELKETFSVDITNSINQPEWVYFVRNHNQASNYHLPATANAIEKAFGHKSKLLLARSNGTVVGGMVVTTVCSRIFGNNCVSTPFFNYGGPLTSYTNVAIKLITEAKQLLSSEGCDQVEIRTTMPNLPFQSIEKKVSMVLSLPKSESELEKQLGSKVRAQINRALEYQPSVKIGGLELLDDFYHVFSINMRDLGTPVYSKDWFTTLLNQQELKPQLVVCYVKENAVSAGFILGSGKLMEIPWASTIKSANGMNMNMWMYRQILGRAIQQHYSHFDFGRSTIGAGTYRFKKQWGAEEVPHYWYYLTSNDEPISTANPDNPKYKLLISTWKLLPVWITKLIGPPIVKSIP